MVFLDKSEGLVEQLNHFHVVLRGVGLELSPKRLRDLEVQRSKRCWFRTIAAYRGLGGWRPALVFRFPSKGFRHVKYLPFGIVTRRRIMWPAAKPRPDRDISSRTFWPAYLKRTKERNQDFVTSVFHFCRLATG